MEFILQDTDIFDEIIDDKFRRIVSKNIDNFIKNKVYVFVVSFHMNLLGDVRFKSFDVINNKINKRLNNSTTNQVLRHQLERMKHVLAENNIDIYFSTIQGDSLEKENMIKIELYEDTTTPSGAVRRKKEKQIKVTYVMPNLPYIKNYVIDFRAERISKKFYDFMEVIKDKRIMSEILQIEHTEDDNKLLVAFADQYGVLWFSTKEIEKELSEQIKERTLAAMVSVNRKL
ncbi:hypothetical protein JHL18_12960 [Clostridium sp. YIM B02505]|uniref:Uncharacterized protein n=1 Tax=Clostridium yunnanense TaxID=2800325 RepID=A0ABS1EQ95_9CLOT|nr:hypothetical protein [Clostridium yunnanense]MBK1811532.1 hypothetical protein [Clostridium yunnanense]